jgi:integrase
MLFLLAVYGLRRSEVALLLLSDFDWVGETFIVRRAKRGRIQQFPIQFEVGEAILAYLRYGRPVCPCPNLFVLSTAPYGPIRPQLLGTLVTDQMKKIGIDSKELGPHSLRHACATQLLKSGSSLHEVADFLGHRGMESVRIYAKQDIKSLKRVIAFRLIGSQ